MTCRYSARFAACLAALILLLLLPVCRAAQPAPSAAPAFDRCAAMIEARLARQHRSAGTFLAALSPENKLRLSRGDLIIEPLNDPLGATLPDALLHHWRGTAFIPGATVADFERLMEDFPAYPQIYSPQVLQASILARRGDEFQTRIRLRQHHVITVILDSSYDVIFARLDARHGYSLSRSNHIAELDSSGQPVNPASDHGFLLRLNTYWSYEEDDGGLYIQIESVSLTRSIPRGLGWIVHPLIESIPRESLTFTLRSTCEALQQNNRRAAR